MAKAKYAKLGEKANSFYDPSTGFKLAKNEVKEINKEEMVSKKIKSAFKHGHLEVADENEYEGNDEVVEDNEDEDEELTEAQLLRKGKEALVALAMETDTELTEKELGKLTKPELVEIILEEEVEE